MIESKLFFALFFVVVTCCSCGNVSAEQAATSTEQVETMSIETATIEKVKTKPGIFKNSESTGKKNRLENDDVRVWDEEWYILWQENLDGTARKRFENENEITLLWLTNDWLYYETYDEEVLYRTPVDRTRTPVYDMSRREPLFHTEYPVRNFMVTDSYIFYSIDLFSPDGDDYRCIFYRYDFETKESAQIFEMEEDLEAKIMTGQISNMPVATEKAFFIEDEESIYRVFFDTLEKKKIYSTRDEEIGPQCLVEQDGSVYFVPEGNEIYKYEDDTDEMSLVLGKKEFQKSFEERKLWDQNGADAYGEIGTIGVYEDRLYMELIVHCSMQDKIEKGPNKGETMACDHVKSVLVSADFAALDRWVLVRDLSDYLSGQTAQALDWDYELSYTRQHVGYIYGIYDGEVLIRVNKEISKVLSKHEYSLETEIYNIDTGEIRRVGSSDYRYCFWDWNN